jgi:hypothetical protein
MATITPSTDGPISTARIVNWLGAATADTITEYAIPEEYGAIGCVQVDGTFGGATVALQVSNDGTTWAALNDVSGNAISVTAAGFAEFSTAAVYIRPAISGGTSDSINVRLAFRGWRG